MLTNKELDLNKLKVGFIGAGNMGQAIMSGWLKKKILNLENLSFYDSQVKRVVFDDLKNPNAIDVAANPHEVLKSSNIIILAVKPQVMKQVLSEATYKKISHKIFISIAAGITLEYLSQFINDVDNLIYRMMPNTPMLVGKGASVFCGNKENRALTVKTDQFLIGEETFSELYKSHFEDRGNEDRGNEDRGNIVPDKLIKALFSSLTLIEKVQEEQMDAVTALSGSGPAYVYLFIESLADVGVQLGLSRDLSIKLASQLMIGGGEMVAKTGEDPQILKDKVCSPGGTTISGVLALEENNHFRSAIQSAVLAAYKKSVELSQNN